MNDTPGQAIEVEVFMGDAVSCHECGVFVRAFGGLVVERFRSRLLDETFGSRARYYLYCGYFDDWRVVLRVVVEAGGKKEEFDIPESSFFPPSDDILDEVSSRLGLATEDAERRWERAVEDVEGEDEDEDDEGEDAEHDP